MSDHGGAEKKEGTTKGGGGGLKDKLPLLLALLNTLTILGVVGLAVYTKILYQKPKVTEAAERARLKAVASAPKPVPVPAMVEFPQLTINIAPTLTPAATGEGAPGASKPKMHYLTMAFMLKIRDDSLKTKVEELRPRIMDKMLAILSRKQVQELSTVQGRWLLRSQFLEITNDLLKQDLKSTEAHATDLYFTQFIVQ
jgi:flagellar basal body-associated protein FliL